MVIISICLVVCGKTGKNRDTTAIFGCEKTQFSILTRTNFAQNRFFVFNDQSSRTRIAWVNLHGATITTVFWIFFLFLSVPAILYCSLCETFSRFVQITRYNISGSFETGSIVSGTFITVMRNHKTSKRRWISDGCFYFLLFFFFPTDLKNIYTYLID